MSAAAAVGSVDVVPPSELEHPATNTAENPARPAPSAAQNWRRPITVIGRQCSRVDALRELTPAFSACVISSRTHGSRKDRPPSSQFPPTHYPGQTHTRVRNAERRTLRARRLDDRKSDSSLARRALLRSAGDRRPRCRYSRSTSELSATDRAAGSSKRRGAVVEPLPSSATNQTTSPSASSPGSRRGAPATRRSRWRQTRRTLEPSQRHRIVDQQADSRFLDRGRSPIALVRVIDAPGARHRTCRRFRHHHLAAVNAGSCGTSE